MEQSQDGIVLLYLINAEDYAKTNLKIMKELVNQNKLSGIYITVNRPYQQIISLLKKNNIDTSAIFFIDAVTKETGGSEVQVNNCIFLDSPTNLTDITIALHKAVELMGNKKKFIFFDTLSTLLIYNNGQTVVKFAHFLTGRMREWNTKGIIISIQKEMDEKLTSQLIQFCDEKVAS